MQVRPRLFSEHRHQYAKRREDVPPRRLRRKGCRRGRRTRESLVPGSVENHEITYGDSGQREVGGEDSRRRRPAGTRLILIGPQPDIPYK